MTARSSPRKSAVVIPLTRTPSGELRALVGRRRSRFLGGFFAFPGGVVEPGDGDPHSADEDACLRRTASRELREETGLAVAPEALLDAGRRVTPPFFPRRFDTRMYVADVATEVPPAPEVPGEMEELQWSGPAELTRRWRALEIRLAPPLIPMLQELAREGEDPVPEVARRLAAVNAEMEGPDGARVEFVPDVLMVPLVTPTLPPATTTNCYLVGAKELIVVDPGGAGAEAERLVRVVRRRAEEGVRPRAVILTHHHVDHVGGAAKVSEALGVPVMAHGATWERWDEGAAVRKAGRAEELVDGQGLELAGGERLRVLHTPGHAAGHVALLERERGSLFTGDLVSGLSTVLLDTAPGSLELYLGSLERIRDVGARTLFPAHGPPMIDPVPAVQAALDHRREREERILAALARGARTLEEVAREAYADTPAAPPALAVRQTASHLDRLARLGRARAQGDRWMLAP